MAHTPTPSLVSPLVRRPIRRAAAAAAWLAAGLTGPAFGAGFDSLSQVEAAAETRDYTLKVSEKKFGPDQEAFVTGVLLAQLSKDANRSAITRTRKRIRELALRKNAPPELFDQVNGLLRDSLARQAGDAEAEPLLRVNAMLMVGELVDSDEKPWRGAAQQLATAAGAEALPLEVRIAALAGLAKHVEAETPGVAPVAGPAVAGLITSPPQGDPVAVRWMQSRALELLPKVSPPPDAVAAAAKILADEAADLDLRVRAAVALGRLARPDAGIDAAAAVTRIHGLAIAALEADIAAAEGRRFTTKIGGPAAGGPVAPAMGGPGLRLGPPPGVILGGTNPFGDQAEGGLPPEVVDADAVPPLACRRDAWRMFRLAEAVKPAEQGTGLAGLLAGDAAADAAALATVLRRAAVDLDAQPDETTLTEALESLRSAGGATHGREAKPGGESPASPFDEPANSSPS